MRKLYGALSDRHWFHCLDHEIIDMSSAPSCPLDVRTLLLVSDTEDINSSLGFLRHLASIMRMKRGGLFSAGVVCGSWTLINRAWVSIIYGKTDVQ